ncbi:5-formyltetrahydrofolate cyclo-ligase [Corynebacterium matruchotii]|uniref:5-formyltetrahydrofolate cyclo-ligase n=1 Tax=Corynebacterium matruchotii TaxID=43768 RepID=UPI0028EA38FF|nr:5-formyltetrahydrofolate cyclo-ligase [Corynebacterium matruchotii]
MDTPPVSGFSQHTPANGHRDASNDVPHAPACSPLDPVSDGSQAAAQAAMAQAKARVRARVRAARTALSPEARAERDAAVVAAVTTLVQDRGWSRVAAYAPMAREPGGSLLVPALARLTTELWLPVCRPGRILRWGRYIGPGSVCAGMWGILEPRDAPQESDFLGSLDGVFVPAIAVNDQGFRLGQGAGFYDRALAGCAAPTVAVVYASEIMPVPHEPHDVMLDIIVSDG